MLANLIVYPVVLWTMPLAVLGAYWVLVLFGALELAMHPHIHVDVDVDLGGPDLGGHDLGGHDLGGHDVGGHDVGGHDVDDVPLFTEIGSFFGLGKAPVVVVLSLFVFAGWATSLLGVAALQGPAGGEPGSLVGTALLAGAFVAGTFSARTGSGLLAPIFRHTRPVRSLDVVGQECVVVTGRVDATFGQADLYSQGSALRVEVRCDRPQPLQRGEKVLVAYYDDARGAFVVEPMTPLLASTSSGSEPR